MARRSGRTFRISLVSASVAERKNVCMAPGGIHARLGCMESRLVCVDDARIEVITHGDVGGSERVLVFLHEGLGSAAQWRNLPRDLAERTGCAAVAYSRAGYGGSDPVPLPRPL